MSSDWQPIGFEKTDIPFEEPLEAWLMKQVRGEAWLLAHMTDGVIWGKMTGEAVQLSHEVAPEVSPPLRLETLQMLRLFNAVSEIRLWRTDTEHHAVRITDTADEPARDETHLLWGTYATQLPNGFVRLEDGAQGLIHVLPPFEGSEQLERELDVRTKSRRVKSGKRVCLHVRHYFMENEMGVNTMGMSRLVGLGVCNFG